MRCLISFHLGRNIVFICQFNKKWYMCCLGTVTRWQTSTWGTYGAVLRGSMSYSNGYITVPRAGVYYIYAQLWSDPHSKGDSKIAGFSIRVNGGATIATAGAVQHYQEDETLYTGVIRQLQKGARLSVVIGRSEYYEFYYANSCFGAFMVQSG